MLQHRAAIFQAPDARMAQNLPTLQSTGEAFPDHAPPHTPSSPHVRDPDCSQSRLPRQRRHSGVPASEVPVRRQRVKVPMRLLSSPVYADVALSVYVKVKALGARPEGCQAKAATIASYLGLSKASVERGLTLLSHPAPDGVVELTAERRTLPGGRGTSAIRRTRPLRRLESFVWLPVAAAEDLTPRQLRAYAVIAFAEKMGIGLTEGELAGQLLHHSGKKAGQPITAAPAGEIVDALEAAKWVSVQRRAGAQGRHRYVAHDIAPVAADGKLSELVADAAPEAVQECPQEPVDDAADGSGSPLVGEGSGSGVSEGSLANKESPRTDSPDDGRALLSPAVGEVPVVEAVENQADAKAHRDAPGGLALRADENNPSSSNPINKKRSNSGGSARSSYTGPQMSMSPQIYSVLEPVHWLLKHVQSPFMERQIAREIGRQLRDGMDAERLRHRLTVRFAAVLASDIRDPGRWLLGVALPRWGCGHLDCESGVLWSNGKSCAACEDVIADRFAARQRAQRLERGLCPNHGTEPGPSGVCPDCEPQQAIDGGAAALPAPREPEGPAARVLR
ncbi:hypothetical protein [Streptomyces sp.]|uniref:hypothetical protein n=1 Tax=Streptomyces sp. TaxID=1931 RepID=UPI002D7A1162|nr:hypothetical protein [Streptomyces sp.]HET6354870.1 hypothetical protein [Streptomyces sp.]